MINEQEGLLESTVKRKAKKKVMRWVLTALGAMAPILIMLIAIIFIGSGVFGAFSSVGAFLNGIFGRSDTETLLENTDMLDGLTEEEILALVVNDKIDSSFYNNMMISKDEFQYLLEKVIEYNAIEVKKNIQIECEHTYLEWVEYETTPSYPANPDAGINPEEPQGEYVKKTERVYKTIEVNSKDIEKFYLDWELVYALCLTDTMNGVDGWRALSESDNRVDKYEHYGPNHEEIDFILSNVQMTYEYVTDLARSPKSVYTLEECKSLVHTKFEYGDEDTTEGKWLYYYPRSVLSRAYSGYSCIYYLLSPDMTMLNNMITASDVKHFELIVDRFCPKYNFGYFATILKLIPGGEELAERLELYYQYKDEGYNISDRGINYIIGDGIDKSLLPTSTERLDTEFGDLTDYGDLIFNEETGNKIVAEALSKVGCEYSQADRWGVGSYDCSSFIWRILQSVGIDLSTICNGSTAAEECRGMVEAGLVVSLSDIQPGDIVFYSGYVNGRYRNITHVAFYAGDNKIVHAANAKDGVKVGNFYKTGFVCVCRPYK